LRPQGSAEGIVAGQTGRLEVVKTALSNVRFGSKADISVVVIDVRFTPESGHRSARRQCPLCAKSGLMHRNKKLFDYCVGPSATNFRA
jgi:hypothetical protein